MMTMLLWIVVVGALAYGIFHRSPAARIPVATRVASPAPVPATVATPAPRGTGARLAIIIDDCGQYPETERGFVGLPIALTLSVLPDVRYGHAIAREAAEVHKGVMLHLPMETLSGMDPGPGKITTAMDDAAIAEQVQHDLDDVPLATGVNNHEGSKATADPRVMEDVARILARDARFFIDSRTTAKSVARQIAGEHGIPTASRDVFIDNRADETYTAAQLRRAAAIAHREGTAIAIGHPRPTTLAAVRAMIPELHADGIEFVLASDLVR